MVAGSCGTTSWWRPTKCGGRKSGVFGVNCHELTFATRGSPRRRRFPAAGGIGRIAGRNGRSGCGPGETGAAWLFAAELTAGIQNVLADEHCKMNGGKPGLGATTIATLLGEPDQAAVLWAISPPE